MMDYIYLALRVVMIGAGLYILIDPRSFLRWGRGGRGSGREPDRAALWAGRFVGLSVITLGVLSFFSMNP